MSCAIAEHSLFGPKPSKAETKADITDHAARAIIGHEAALRAAKSARLRAGTAGNRGETCCSAGVC